MAAALALTVAVVLTVVAPAEAVAAVNKMGAPGNAPIRHGRIKRLGSTMSL